MKPGDIIYIRARVCQRDGSDLVVEAAKRFMPSVKRIMVKPVGRDGKAVEGDPDGSLRVVVPVEAVVTGDAIRSAVIASLGVADR